MTTPNPDSVLATNPCPENTAAPLLLAASASDVNDNSSKGLSTAPPPAGSVMSEGTIPIMAAPGPLGNTVALPQVASSPNVVGFPSGMNLTISNGIINVKNPNGGESTLLVAPTTSLSTSSIVSSASAPIPVTMVKGTLTSLPASLAAQHHPQPPLTVTMTTPSASLLTNTQVTQTHTQLKVPNPPPQTIQVPNHHPQTIQVRPQMFSTLQNSNIAMVMQNRLSLPFQASAGGSQALAVPTSIGTLRSLAPGSVPASSVLSQQVQFQTMAPLRGTAVTIATGSPHPGGQHQQLQSQQGQAQSLAIRSAQATAFPLVLNRPLAFTGRPQLITAQPTRLAPRQMGPQVALQMAGGQQAVSGATIMPLFRPAQSVKPVSVSGTIMSNAAISVQTHSQQPQFVNQVLATANVPGMTQINFRPSMAAPKAVERPQKLVDNRLRAAVPVNRFARPSGGPITFTTLPGSIFTGDGVLTVAQAMPTHAGPPFQDSSGGIMVGTSALPRPENKAQTPEKKKTTEMMTMMTTMPEAKKIVPPTMQAAVVSSQDVAMTSVQLLAAAAAAPQLVPKSPAGKDAAWPLKGAGQVVSSSSTSSSSLLMSLSAPSEVRRVDGGDVMVSAAATSSDFDALKVMEWSDGIASLPGSNLKFKLNEFGLMEMVPEDGAGQGVKTVVDSAVGVNTTNFTITATIPSETGVSDTQAEVPKKEKEPLKKCENCGKYGYQRDFCKTGRFCSQTCVGAFAGR
ncbi:hypothetical protein ACOMHN_039090 [Nucella lapillus]